AKAGAVGTCCLEMCTAELVRLGNWAPRPGEQPSERKATEGREKVKRQPLQERSPRLWLMQQPGQRLPEINNHEFHNAQKRDRAIKVQVEVEHVGDGVRDRGLRRRTCVGG